MPNLFFRVLIHNFHVENEHYYLVYKLLAKLLVYKSVVSLKDDFVEMLDFTDDIAIKKVVW